MRREHRGGDERRAGEEGTKHEHAQYREVLVHDDNFYQTPSNGRSRHARS